MWVFWPIIKSENVRYYKGIFNRQIRKVKKSYQENQGWYPSFSARAGIIYWLHDYFQLVYIGSKFQLVYIGSKFQLGLSNLWWNFSSV